MIDAEKWIQAQRESRHWHDERCRWCGRKLALLSRDRDEPTPDQLCGRCLSARLRSPAPTAPAPPILRKRCNRCCDVPPLRGMSWCGPCALKAQDQRVAMGEDPVVVEVTVASIRAAIAAEADVGI